MIHKRQTVRSKELNVGDIITSTLCKAIYTEKRTTIRNHTVNGYVKIFHFINKNDIELGVNIIGFDKIIQCIDAYDLRNLRKYYLANVTTDTKTED